MNETELQECIGRLETPFYIYDKDILKATVRSFRSELKPGIRLCYAMKANPFMTGFMAPLTDRIEVCSFGESRIVKDLGVAPEKLLISGVLKKEEDLSTIVDDFGDMPLYTVESPAQFRLLEENGRRRHLSLKVLLRLTNGSQFGMDPEQIERILAARPLESKVIGIHYFTGTQKRNFSVIRKELAYISEFMDRMNEKYGYPFTCLEYGPGFRIDYFNNTNDFILTKEEWEELNRYLSNIREKYEVTLEMGRALTAECGYYVTGVRDIKVNRKIHYAIVDGGIHQMNYDGQVRGIYRPDFMILKGKKEETRIGGNEKWTVCGSLCTTNDILLLQQDMQDLSVGDRIVFRRTGAYSVNEGMALFLSHELPCVYSFSRNEGIHILRDRLETYGMTMDRMEKVRSYQTIESEENHERKYK